MTQISSTSSSKAAASSSSTNGTKGNDFSSVNLDQFLQLMITQLQNQDPLNPTDNNDMLNQLTQIRQMGATNQLSSTLTDFSVGQQLSMSSSLIGKTVSALDSDAKEVTGVVSKVSVQVDEKDKTKRNVKVHIGDSIVDMSNIREIDQPAAKAS